ncbi:MAG: hypothetical protein ACRDRJ_03120 [Streptosporangiaceae bacterium]
MPDMDAVLQRMDELETRQRDQADVIASLGDVGDQVAQLSELLADLTLKVGLDGDDEAPGRMPRPTPQWHKLTTEELAAELHKLRGYEKEIIPLLGHMAKLGSCWPKHPLACIVMDVFGELWQGLFQTDRRPPKILAQQADFLIRVAPGLLQLLAKETANCPKHDDLAVPRG